MSLYKNRIGVLGGSFDPAHKGHLTISIIAKKKLQLNKIIWAITKKSPFKNKSENSITSRIGYCKKIVGKNTFIKERFYENLIKSNKTIDLINHLKKNKKNDIYFLMGADNLIKFHKWHKWRLISKKCKIVVFDRQGFKKKSLNSVTFKKLSKENLKFFEFDKVNISSSQLRKI